MATEKAILGDMQSLAASLKALQDGQTTLERNQERTSVLLEGMMSALKDLRTDLTAVERNVNERSRTQWSTIWAAIGTATAIVVVVGGIISYAWSTDMAHLAERVNGLGERVTQHNAEEGHPHSVIERIRATKEQIETRFDQMEGRLDERLVQRQREMDELRKAIDNELNRARNRLERLETKGDRF